MKKKPSQKERMKMTLELYGDEHREFRKTNPTPQEVRAANIKVVVAEPAWQKIRHGFIGTWNDTPKENVWVLEQWLGDGKDPIRVRQILNYVTSSGFRIGIISHPEIDRIRDKVRGIWKKMLEA
jgi:hypothetical protein